MVFKKEMGIALTLQKIFHSVLDFIFPQLCVLCQTKLNKSHYAICGECTLNLNKSNLSDMRNFYTHNFGQLGLIKDFYSSFEFIKDGGFQKIIHELKYCKKSNLGIYLGMILAKELNEIDWFHEIDLIIPVPIHHNKKFERGYNQSEKICKGIQKVTNKKFYVHIVKRKKYTQTQTHLTLQERIKNVSDAFVVTKSERVKDKSLLIIDDVCTTGATANELARTLLEAGAKQVYLATLSYVKNIDINT